MIERLDLFLINAFLIPARFFRWLFGDFWLCCKDCGGTLPMDAKLVREHVAKCSSEKRQKTYEG